MTGLVKRTSPGPYRTAPFIVMLLDLLFCAAYAACRSARRTGVARYSASVT